MRHLLPNKNKRPDRSINKIRNDYNIIASHYAVTRKIGIAEFQLLIPYLKPHDTILDVGCGSGKGLMMLSSTKISVDYTGIDISEQQIKEAKKQYPQAHFVIGNMMTLLIPNASCDIVMLLASFHHLGTKEDREQTLSEIYRVLKPGGILFMTNWNLWQPRFFHHYGENIRRCICQKEYSFKDFFIPWNSPSGQRMAERYYYAFSKKELYKLCTTTGFMILQNDYTKGNKVARIWDASNLVTIGQKQ